MTKKPTIAIIGAGNMGSALAGGIIAGQGEANNIWLTDASEEKLKQLEKSLGTKTTTHNAEAIEKADVVILAIKPQTMAEVLQELKPLIQKKKPLILSIVTGIRESKIQNELGGQIAIVRVMPNTPALIGCGASGLHANSFVSKEQRLLAETIMRSVGLVVWVEDESKIDAITAISGSGPAYFFLIIESLQKAAEKLGLPPDMARLLSVQTAYGAARMALENDKDVITLRQQVTSPGGTTERAIGILEQGQIRNLIEKAAEGAKQRSEELSTLLDTSKK